MDGFAAMVADTTIVPQASGEPTIETGYLSLALTSERTSERTSKLTSKPTS